MLVAALHGSALLNSTHGRTCDEMDRSSGILVRFGLAALTDGVVVERVHTLVFVLVRPDLQVYSLVI